MMLIGDPGDLVATAVRLREVAGQVEPAFSTRQIIEACFPDAAVTGRHLPPGIEEMVTRTSEGPLIVYSRTLHPPRQRFVIAHAIAHLLFDGDRIMAAARPGFVGCPEAEARADAFAAELLVPLAELASYVGVPPGTTDDLYLDQVDEIASHFNVTTCLIDQRIRELLR